MADRTKQDQPDGGHDPAAENRIGKEQQCADSGADRQDHLGGDRGVVGGVADTGDQVGRGVGDLQPVLVEPVADRLDEHREAEQDRELSLSCDRSAPPGAGQLDRPHHVVHDRRGHEAEAQGGEDEGQREAPPRIVEDEERDIQPELGLLDAERGGVAPGQVGQGLPGGSTAGEEAENDPDRDHHGEEAHLQDFSVALQQWAGGRLGPHPGPEAVSDRRVRGHRRRHDEPEAHEQADPGQQHGVEHRTEVEGVEPQPGRPEAGEDGEDDHQDRDDHQGRQNGTAPATHSHATQPFLLIRFRTANRLQQAGGLLSSLRKRMRQRLSQPGDELVGAQKFIGL